MVPMMRREILAFEGNILFIVVIWKLLKCHSKAKHRASAYSRALRQIRWVAIILGL